MDKSYRGFNIAVVADLEDDNIKKWFEITSPTGVIHWIDCPYGAANDLAEQWVDGILAKS